MKYVSTRFVGEDGKILILFIGLASGVGRLVFGRIADIPRVDRILLQQVSRSNLRNTSSSTSFEKVFENLFPKNNLIDMTS